MDRVREHVRAGIPFVLLDLQYTAVSYPCLVD
jgi:hypothetical protein